MSGTNLWSCVLSLCFSLDSEMFASEANDGKIKVSLGPCTSIEPYSKHTFTLCSVFVYAHLCIGEVRYVSDMVFI